MLLRLIVINENFAVLPESSWLLLGDADDAEDGLAFVEDGVHFFEGAVGSFRVEEVYDGENECVAVVVLVVWK